MLDTVKKRIKEYILFEIGKAFSESRQQIEKAFSENRQRIEKAFSKNRRQIEQLQWNDLVAINPEQKEFRPLREVSHYREGKTEIDPADIGLEKDLDHYISRDPLCLPSTEDREGYMDDRHFEFWLFGLSDYIKIKRFLAKHGRQLSPGCRVYDMGCASGRVARHFLCQEDGLDLWASDINANHVDWISKYLNGVKAFQNHSIPHLPFEDNFLDLAYAFSVFTHIASFETAWLMELRRIMKPGGIAYLTTHSEHTWAILDEKMPIYQALATHPDFGPDLPKSAMPREKMIFRWHGRTYGANVFYHSDHIRNVWGNFFEILDIIREGCFYQDVVLLRKREKS